MENVKFLELPDGRQISFCEQGLDKQYATRSLLVLHGLGSSRLAGMPENFMTNYSISYDRAKMTIGWTPSDCKTDLTPTSLPPGSVPIVATPPPTSLPVTSTPAPTTVLPPPNNSFGSAATAMYPSIQLMLLVFFTLSVAFLI